MNDTRKTREPLTESSESLDWRAVYHFLREKLWLIILCLVLAICVGIGYMRRAEVFYGARAVIQVDVAEQRIMNITDVQPDALRSDEMLNSLVQTVTSSNLLKRVVIETKLNRDPDFMTLPPNGEVPLEEAVGFLKQHVTCSLRKDTRLIDINAEHPNPEVARKMAQGVVEQIVVEGFTQRAEAAQAANEYLLQEARRLQEKVTSSERALHQFRKDNDAISLEESQNIVSVQLRDLNGKLSAAKGDRLRLESDVAKAAELAGRPKELLTVPSIATAGPVISLKSQISAKEGELTVISQRYKAKHPNYIQVVTELNNLRAALDKAAVDAGSYLSESFRQAEEIEKGFQKALKAQEARQLELNQLAIDYNIRNRELQADRALYDSVLARMKETDISKGIKTSPIHIIERASSQSQPVRPNKQKILLGSILGGLVAGIGLAIGLSLLDNTLKTVDRVETTLNLPVLAAIPLSRRAARGKKPLLPLLNDPRDAMSESIRSLRTALTLLGREQDRRTFLFTSALSGEGKSFCAANCAISLAQQGLSTLLIDADLREPVLASMLLQESKVAGLTDYLIGRGGLELARRTEVTNLRLLTAGTQAPNPAELLTNKGFARLLQEALTKYDRVVVDSAPIIPVSDTLLLAPHVQSVCLVVRAASTPVRAVLRACRALKDISCKPVGAIFNCVPQNSGGFYYSYNASGTYGRDGIYGSAAASESKGSKPVVPDAPLIGTGSTF